MVNTPHPVNAGKQEDTTGELQVEQTTKKSVAQILFNPSDPKYKKVEDLPRAFRDDFIDTEDETGFVRKDADKNYLEAQRQADKNIRYGKTEGLNTMDVLYDSMLSEEEILARIIASGKFDGIKEKREVSIESYGKGIGIIIKAEKGIEEVNITNELYEKKILTRNFFMRLVEAGVKFENPDHTIPLELRNDKEFLLNLVEKTETVIFSDTISKQIILEEGNDFLFKLIEVGGNIYGKNDKIIEEYFADKDHLFVIDYLNKNNFKKDWVVEKVYLAIIEKFKDNRSVKDMLEIILKKHPRVASFRIIINSYELKSMALGILKKMTPDESLNEIIKNLESYNK